MIILNRNLARSLISTIHRGFILVLIASSTHFTRKLCRIKLQVLEMIFNLAQPRSLDNNLQSYISFSLKRILRKSKCRQFGPLESCTKWVSEFTLAGDQVIAKTRLWWSGGRDKTTSASLQLKSCSIRVLFTLLQEGCREIGHSKPSGKPPRISGK
jgi:hypothetical protein